MSAPDTQGGTSSLASGSEPPPPASPAVVGASAPVPAGLLRRLGAMVYDALLLIALMAIATMLMLPLTGGEGISERHGPLKLIYQFILLGIFVGFHGYYWTRTGQTLGMAAWRLRLRRGDGSRLTWTDVIRRLAGALVALAAGGLGYLWIWVDRERLAWHDRWTRTRVLHEPKQRNS